MKPVLDIKKTLGQLNFLGVDEININSRTCRAY